MTHDELNIVSANLSALADEASSVYERRLAHLYGLARALDGGTLSDALRSEYEELKEAIMHNKPAQPQAHFGRLCSRSDRIALCRFIYEHLVSENPAPENPASANPANESRAAGNLKPPSAEELLGCMAFDDEAEEPNRVCYLHNFYADKAFSVFAEVLENPTVNYASDFVSVCEDVYYGRSKYCILPVESSADGLLSGFRALVGKYELNYVLSCEIPTQDGESFTRFALLHRGTLPPPDVPGDRIFEFSVSFDDGGAMLSDVLDAAEAYGLKLRHINLLPASYSGRSGMYDLAFLCGESRLAEFVVFLSLEVPQFEPLGIYVHIGNEE